MDDVTERLQELMNELNELLTQADMTHILFCEVVERTQNFREGFYSQRKIHDLTRTATKAMQVGQQTATTTEDIVGVVEEFVQNMKNVLATTMTEIDRLDN